MEEVTWGRRARAGLLDGITATAIVIFTPLWLYTDWIILEHFGGSLSSTFNAVWNLGPSKFAFTYFPRISAPAFAIYIAWVLFQAFLFHVSPGKHCKGQRTPAGHLLEYNCNGIFAFSVTHSVFLIAVAFGLLDPSLVARHWEGLMVAADVYGVLLSTAAVLKGYQSPTFPEDRKQSGSLPFDFFSGVELNPRIGKTFDLKLFHNGRPGIIAWTLINLSWATYQYQTHGVLTNSMIIVNILQAIYVVDFFLNEDWYTRTVDIAHDHFGFYLAWGSVSFLPQLYTIEAQYLARYPTYLSNFQSACILGLGLAGYALFRSANWQKDIVRRTSGKVTIWGRPAKTIHTTYRTSDGKHHQGLLLVCGWWGVCRHVNYLADLIQTFAWCATCGFSLPWIHFVWMLVLLLGRLRRDERRCRNKYGEQWGQYCREVPYRLILGVW